MQMTTLERIQANLFSVLARIASAAERGGKDAKSVALIAVTKSVGVEEVRILAGLGVRHFGENRVEQSGEKLSTLGTGVVWHMIGNVQRRKVRDVVERFDRIDAVDRWELAEAIEKCAAELGKTMPVLVEVNVSGEAAKHGFAPHELADTLRRMTALSHLRVEGLMTMAPFGEDPDDARPVFRALKELADRYGLPVRSMGMTNDFEVAIEEGATEVRIGTALFQ